jgi:hypothetical protein
MRKFWEFIKKIWKVFVTVLAIGATVWGLLESIYWVTDYFHDQQIHNKKIDTLEKTLLDVINGDKEKDFKIEELNDYIEQKKHSYAVGFRVEKQILPDGSIQKKKMYRDWDGHWHEVHLDNHMTAVYGIDYYFYIDKNTGEKVYCW